MMLIVRGNLRARVSAATSEEIAWLGEYLSFPDKSWNRRHETSPGGGPPRKSVLNQLNQTFPAGFTSLVARAAADTGVVVQFMDKRKRPCAPDPNADLEWLRWHPAALDPIVHQVAAVEAVVREERGLLWVPTGGGKTEIAIGLTRALPCRWLFLVDDRGLLKQAADRFEDRTNTQAGRVGDGLWEPRWPFCVATFQSLHAGLKRKDPKVRALLKDADAVCADEVHVVPARTFLKVLMATPNAYYRVGMSGMPLARGDQRSILAIGALGTVIFRVRNEELQEAGILSTGTARMYPCEQYSLDDGDWEDVYQELVVDSPVRNRLVLDIVRHAPKPALLFVREIAHGRRLEAMVRAAGIDVEFVWGQDNSAERDAAVRRLERGDVAVLVCSTVFNKGVDIPDLASGVNAAGGASVIQTVQKLGRTGRATVSKTSFTFYDVLDKGNKWLAKHARARMRAYVAEGHSTLVVEPAELRRLLTAK